MGSPQVINCTVSTVSGVESNSVMISWMGSGGGSIISGSRVTISPTTSSGNTHTSSLQFTYLVEGDEGMYICNVMILESSGSQSVELQSLISKYSSNFTHFNIIIAYHSSCSHCECDCPQHSDSRSVTNTAV